VIAGLIESCEPNVVPANRSKILSPEIDGVSLLQSAADDNATIRRERRFRDDGTFPKRLLPLDRGREARPVNTRLSHGTFATEAVAPVRSALLPVAIGHAHAFSALALVK
jgi:hypothetical protein